MIYIYSILIINILVFEKIACLLWFKINRDILVSMGIIKNSLYLSRFVNLTTVSSVPVLFSSIYSIITGRYPPVEYMEVIWNQTFTITIGYWFIVFPSLLNIDCPKTYLLDFYQHLPVLVLYTLSLLNSGYTLIFSVNGLIYSLIYGYLYLFFIWYPYYLYTGDTIYTDMGGSLLNRIMTISKINIISIIGHIVGRRMIG